MASTFYDELDGHDEQGSLHGTHVSQYVWSNAINYLGHRTGDALSPENVSTVLCGRPARERTFFFPQRPGKGIGSCRKLAFHVKISENNGQGAQLQRISLMTHPHATDTCPETSGEASGRDALRMLKPGSGRLLVGPIVMIGVSVPARGSCLLGR
jgi:hypothetical protein